MTPPESSGSAAPSVSPEARGPRLLVRFRWDCRRNGVVEGLFVTTQAELDANWGKFVQFGEILGKHSDVSGKLEPKDIEVLSEDQPFIDKLVDVLSIRISGYCPFDYVRGDDE